MDVFRGDDGGIPPGGAGSRSRALPSPCVHSRRAGAIHDDPSGHQQPPVGPLLVVVTWLRERGPSSLPADGGVAIGARPVERPGETPGRAPAGLLARETNSFARLTEEEVFPPYASYSPALRHSPSRRR